MNISKRHSNEKSGNVAYFINAWNVSPIFNRSWLSYLNNVRWMVYVTTLNLKDHPLLSDGSFGNRILCRPVRGCIEMATEKTYSREPRVKASSNNSTVALRVVTSDEGETLFLRDINTGTWPSRLEESRIWDSKIRSGLPRDSNLRMTALARTSSKCNWLILSSQRMLHKDYNRKCSVV
jgi:hypothetical protein